jgi:hypothetical protein
VKRGVVYTKSSPEEGRGWDEPGEQGGLAGSKVEVKKNCVCESAVVAKMTSRGTEGRVLGKYSVFYASVILNHHYF